MSVASVRIGRRLWRSALLALQLALPVALVVPLTGCNGVFYQPSRRTFYHPQSMGLAYTDLFVETRAGRSINLWHFPAAGRARGIVLQFHGNAENMTSHYTSLHWLTQHGFELVSFDYPGYGRSSGEATARSVHDDSLEVTEALSALAHRRGLPLILYGQSLGGAVALRTFADLAKPQRVAVVVIESGFYSYQTIAMQKVAPACLPGLDFVLVHLLVSDRFGTDAGLAMPGRTRLIVLGSRQDPVVPFENGRMIFERSSAEKVVIEVGLRVHLVWGHARMRRRRAAFVGLLGQAIATNRPFTTREFFWD